MAKLLINEDVLAEMLFPGVRIGSIKLLEKPHGYCIEVEVKGLDVPDSDRVMCTFTTDFSENAGKRTAKLTAV